MQLTAIVCTFDRYRLAETCVASILGSRSYDAEAVEILVVDNTPPPRRRAMAVPNSVRVIPCDTPGLSLARNAGIAVAGGDIVGFIDDDARVHDGWCAAVRRAFERHRDAEACGGRTLPLHETHDLPAWFYPELTQHLSCIDWSEEARPIEAGEWIVGANMAFRRAVFDRVGLFDPSLGRKGTASLLSNEESALLRAIGRDHTFYIPDMVVDHLVPRDRISADWFRKRVFWQAVSDVLAGLDHMTSAEALAGLSEISASAPAESRGLRLLRYEPRNPQEMRDQLSAVYLQALLLATGSPRREGSGLGA